MCLCRLPTDSPSRKITSSFSSAPQNDVIRCSEKRSRERTSERKRFRASVILDVLRKLFLLNQHFLARAPWRHSYRPRSLLRLSRVFRPVLSCLCRVFIAFCCVLSWLVSSCLMSSVMLFRVCVTMSRACLVSSRLSRCCWRGGGKASPPCRRKRAISRWRETTWPRLPTFFSTSPPPGWRSSRGSRLSWCWPGERTPLD